MQTKMTDHLKSNKNALPLGYYSQTEDQKSQVKKYILNTAHHRNLNKQTNDQ